MHFLIRRQFIDSGDWRDTAVYADHLNIGVINEQHIVFLGEGVAGRQAKLSKKLEGFKFQPFGWRRFLLGRKRMKSVYLNSGSVVTLGQWRLQLLLPPQGFDALIVVFPSMSLQAPKSKLLAKPSHLSRLLLVLCTLCCCLSLLFLLLPDR